MTKQIFRCAVPIKILFDVLDEVCLKTDKYYLIDMNAYKKYIYNDIHTRFIETIRDYYHASKQFYVTRKVTYNSFTNMIRQICKVNNVMFTSNIRYNESKYNINYLIYY